MRALRSLILCLCILTASAAVARTVYTVTDLGTGVYPLDINSQRQVIAMIHSATGKPSRAVLWNGHRKVDVGAKLPGTDPWVVDINDAGQVLCKSSDSSYTTHYYVYRDGNRSEVFGLYWALGIDEDGRIYGGNPAGLNGLPAVWDNGVVTALPTFTSPVNNCMAFGANRSGQIFGYTNSDDGDHATAWQDGIAQNLDILGLTRGSYANAISDTGMIAGVSTWWVDDTFHSDAVLWNLKGEATLLGTLGGDWSWANDVNSSGQVAGHAATATGEARAFLWQNGVMTDLNTLVKTRHIIDDASAISDEGRILCTGYYRGASHGLILVPRLTSGK
jgi:probable HAF family extracellular repeat protein